MPRRALLAFLAGIAFASGCRGSILNPEREYCTVTRVDSIPDPWGLGDSTSFTVITHEWCEWH